MATTSQHHRNSSSTSLNGTARKRGFRANRPAPLTRRPTPSKVHKLAVSQDSTNTDRSEVESERDEAESMSFQQFCAACDNQLIITNSSVLYCSEKCRKADAIQSPAYPLFKTDRTSPQSADASPENQPHADIIPQRSPTAQRNSSYFQLHVNTQEQPSDVSKPRKKSRERDGRPQIDRTESEAAKYLQQFHSEGTIRHSRTSTEASVHMPSLSNTSVSSASMSVPSTPASTSPSTSRRGLPPRSNHRWSSVFSSRSIDLVTPVSHCPTAPSSLTTLKEARSPTSTGSLEHESTPLSYEKKMGIISPTASSGQSSLRTLFASPESRLDSRNSKNG